MPKRGWRLTLVVAVLFYGVPWVLFLGVLSVLDSGPPGGVLGRAVLAAAVTAAWIMVLLIGRALWRRR